MNIDKKEMLKLLLDETDDIVPGSKGDQVREGFEIVDVIDIIPVIVVKCRWNGESHIRFIDPAALARKKEIRVHQYLVAIGGFVGDRWQAAAEGVRRGSELVKKIGDILTEVLIRKLTKI